MPSVMPTMAITIDVVRLPHHLLNLGASGAAIVAATSESNVSSAICPAPKSKTYV